MLILILIPTTTAVLIWILILILLPTTTAVLILIGKIVTKGKDLFGRPVIFIYAGKHNKYKRSLEELKVTYMIQMLMLLL